MERQKAEATWEEHPAVPQMIHSGDYSRIKKSSVCEKCNLRSWARVYGSPSCLGGWTELDDRTESM